MKNNIKNFRSIILYAMVIQFFLTAPLALIIPLSKNFYSEIALVILFCSMWLPLIIIIYIMPFFIPGKKRLRKFHGIWNMVGDKPKDAFKDISTNYFKASLGIYIVSFVSQVVTALVLFSDGKDSWTWFVIVSLIIIAAINLQIIYFIIKDVNLKKSPILKASPIILLIFQVTLSFIAY